MIKWGLSDIPPILFSALRYTIASCILLFIVFAKKSYRIGIERKDRKFWILVFLYGFFFIFLTQGAQYISLALLPATELTLILNLTFIIVALLSAAFLKEQIRPIQLLLIITSVFGLFLFFYGKIETELSMTGLIVAVFCMLANAMSVLLGRILNRTVSAPAVVITTLSITFGSIFLFFTSLMTESFPNLSLGAIMTLLWLAVVNTVIAFVLWNKSQQTLRAVDSTLINNTMTPQIVFLAFLFLHEVPTGLELAGIGILVISIALMQFCQAKIELRGENISLPLLSEYKRTIRPEQQEQERKSESRL